MIKFIAIFLCVFTFAPIIFSQLSIWDAQGLAAQAGILAFFCLHLFKLNRPLSLLFGWVSLQTLAFHYQARLLSGYDLLHILPFFNFLTLVILYILYIYYLNTKYIENILNYFNYALLIVIAFAVLQVFGLSQFLQPLDLPESMQLGTKIYVTSFLGNPIHLSGYLATFMPLFFGKGLYKKLTLILIWILILFYTQHGKIALSGIIIGLSVNLYYFFNTDKKKFFCFLVCLLIISGFILLKLKPDRLFFDFSGRLAHWKRYLIASKETFILGKGLGAIMLNAIKTGDTFKHAHNEYIHFLLELGLVGFLLIINLICDVFKKVKQKSIQLVKLQSIFFGFLVSCFFTYPAHLWAVTLPITFIYAGIYTLKNEEIK